MFVTYNTIELSRLSEIKITDGQIIAIKDADAVFYDMNGQRRAVTGQVIATELPADGSYLPPNTLLFVTQGSNKGLWWWTGVEFDPVANLTDDSHVQSDIENKQKFYVVGTNSQADESITTLLKNLNVYVDGNTGALYANRFSGGSADNADNAKHAVNSDNAISDSLGQTISNTYIKNITIEGTTISIEYGDGNKTTQQTIDTNTHSVTKIVFAESEMSSEDSPAGNGDVHINLFDDDVQRSSHRIIGEGATSVYSDPSGVLHVESTDTWVKNTASTAGYVAPGIPNKVWATDNTGEPSWTDSADAYDHPLSGVNPGTYKSVTVDAKGHVTAGSNPITLEGFGITDGLAYSTLLSSDDLNTITDPGFYLGPSDNSIENKPEDVDQFGVVIIPITDTNGVIQKLFDNTGKCYYRVSDGEQFDDWKLTTEGSGDGYVHPSTPGWKHIPMGGEANQILVWADDGTAEWADPERIATSEMVGCTETEDGQSGAVPAPEAGPANAYLRNDGVWEIPPDTQYQEVIGTDGIEDGQSGLVPAPTAADVGKFLSSSGDWQELPTIDVIPKWEEFIPEGEDFAEDADSETDV